MVEILKPYTAHGITLLTRENDTYHDDEYVLEEILTYNVDQHVFGTAIDLGSHIGAFTCWLADRQPQCEIAALEPSPRNYAVLRENLKPYPNTRSWCSYVSYDMSDEPMAIMLHPSHTTCDAVMKRRDVQPEMQTTVAPAPMTLEHIMGSCGWEILGLLKIDIEGGENDVLMGCSDETLLRTTRIVGEFHRGPEHFMSTVGARLTRFGFKVTAQPDPNAHATFLAER